MPEGARKRIAIFLPNLGGGGAERKGQLSDGFD